MSNYVYKGLPLTPTTAMSLIKQHFCGKDAKRIDMINVMLDTNILFFTILLCFLTLIVC